MQSEMVKAVVVQPVVVQPVVVQPVMVQPVVVQPVVVQPVVVQPVEISGLPELTIFSFWAPAPGKFGSNFSKNLVAGGSGKPV